MRCMAQEARRDDGGSKARRPFSTATAIEGTLHSSMSYREGPRLAAKIGEALLVRELERREFFEIRDVVPGMATALFKKVQDSPFLHRWQRSDHRPRSSFVEEQRDRRVKLQDFIVSSLV